MTFYRLCCSVQKKEEESGKLLREREKKIWKITAAKLKTNLHAYLGLLLPSPSLLLTLPCIHSL